MEINLFKFSKKKNSTAIPSGSGTTLNVNLKEDTSIYSPSFLITSTSVPNYTYLKWDSRYYYINDIVKLTIKNVYEVVCTLDYLGTLKEDILNSVAFVQYSESKYNALLPDSRVNFTQIGLTKRYDVKFKDFASDMNTVIQYISEDSTNHLPTSYAVVSNANMNELCQQLMSNDLSDSLDKQLDSSASAIVGCKKFIFQPTIAGTESFIIKLGNYNTHVVGFPILKSVRESGTLTITFDYQYDSDFRVFEPYTKWILYLCGYGYIELPSEYMYYLYLYNDKNLELNYTLDNINGTITWNINSIGKFDGVTAINIPVAYSGVNAINTISSIVGAGASLGAGIGSAIAGNPLGLVSGIAGAVSKGAEAYVSGNTKVIGTQGANSGSMASIVGGNDESFSPILYRINLKADNYNDFLHLQGRLLQEKETLGNLSGYVQTVNASIVSSYPKEIVDEVNTMLDGGIYVE